ncbi:MAG: hypothetical protein ACKO45_14965 [Cyanobium sp.]
MEKLLKAWIVLADRLPPKAHDPADLAAFAVEARYEEGPFPLPAERQRLLTLLEQELAAV